MVNAHSRTPRASVIYLTRLKWPESLGQRSEISLPCVSRSLLSLERYVSSVIDDKRTSVVGYKVARGIGHEINASSNDWAG